jgi:hypothetical protein
VAAVIDRRPVTGPSRPIPRSGGKPDCFRHAGPDPGIRTRTVAARFERRAAICRRSKTRLRGVVPQHSGTLTCCSNSIPRGRSSSIKRFPKRGEVGEAGQKVISLRLQ